MNSRHGKGFGGFMFKLIGFTSNGPQVSLPTRLLLVKDKKGCKTLLQQLAATPSLKRVIVSHGDDARERRGRRAAPGHRHLLTSTAQASTC